MSELPENDVFLNGSGVENNIIQNNVSDKDELNKSNEQTKNLLKTENFSVEFISENGNHTSRQGSVDSYENIEIADYENTTTKHVDEGIKEINKSVIGTLGYEQKDSGNSIVKENLISSDETVTENNKVDENNSTKEDETEIKNNIGNENLDSVKAAKVEIILDKKESKENEKVEESMSPSNETEEQKNNCTETSIEETPIQNPKVKNHVSISNSEAKLIQNKNKIETELHMNNTQPINTKTNKNVVLETLSNQKEAERITYSHNIETNNSKTYNDITQVKDKKEILTTLPQQNTAPEFLNRKEKDITEVDETKEKVTNTNEIQEKNEPFETTIGENTVENDVNAKPSEQIVKEVSELFEQISEDSTTDDDMTPPSIETNNSPEPIIVSEANKSPEANNLPEASKVSEAVTSTETSSEVNTPPETNKTEANTSPETSKTEVNISPKIDKIEEATSDDSNKDPPPPEWLDILGNGLLKKKIIQKGLGEQSRPIAGDIVQIRCEGKLDDGTIVDKNSCLQLILSEEDVITALDLSIALMHDKEIALVDTDPRYAYGIIGRPDYVPPIPQNAHIVYEVEILSVERGKEIEQLKPQEMVLYGDKKRARGNDLYARGDYPGSINAYKRGLKYLSNSLDPAVVAMKIKCLNNLSAAQIKVKAYGMALISLDAVLHLEPKNVKAIFRKGKCYVGLNKDEDALRYIKEASMLDPKNKIILQELNKVRASVAAIQKKEKEIYQRMFSQKQKESQTDKETKEKETSYWPYILGSVVVATIGIAAGLWWRKNR